MLLTRIGNIAKKLRMKEEDRDLILIHIKNNPDETDINNVIENLTFDLKLLINRVIKNSELTLFLDVITKEIEEINDFIGLSSNFENIADADKEEISGELKAVAVRCGHYMERAETTSKALDRAQRRGVPDVLNIMPPQGDRSRQ